MPSRFIPKRRQPRKAHRTFWRSWLASPRQIGAIAPSGRALARCMAAQVDLNLDGTIIELGAGTGVMTHALLERGTSPDRLLVVELNERLHGLLQRHFPQLNVVCGDACKLEALCKEHEIGRVSAVVSSLPLLVMPKHVQEMILQQVYRVLAPDGVLIQFTYSPRTPVSRVLQKRCHMPGKRVRRVWRNLPPVSVWVYKPEKKS
jgi:phosphatidylethanolamine/phosphatidyl-N-methylethanolamine N-methyltransferase